MKNNFIILSTCYNKGKWVKNCVNSLKSQSNQNFKVYFGYDKSPDDTLDNLKVNKKLITDGDVSGALYVTDNKFGVDMFIGIGGGPEGVLAASALDASNCFFQGRFIFKESDDIKRAKQMGIKDLDKKYELNEIISGDSIFSATGITDGDLVKGIEITGKEYISETLVTHKNSNTFEVISKKEEII